MNNFLTRSAVTMALCGALLTMLARPSMTVAQQDDLYEPNDSWFQAYGLNSCAGSLSAIDGPGLSANEDWYYIDLGSGNDQLEITCTFSHALGDIDIELYGPDLGTSFVVDSLGELDVEMVSVSGLLPGRYYVRVTNFDSFTGNAYDLSWSSGSNNGCSLWEVCGAVDVGGDWFWLDWFGYFNRGFDPWVYHEQHKFMYPFGEDCNGVVFWDNEMQAFWWTSSSVYPYVFRFADNEWLFFDETSGLSGNPRWFNILSIDQWERWPPAP